MAEAIAAISVAAGVVGLVDFGMRTVSTFWHFVRNGADAKTEIPDFKSTTHDLQELLKNLQSSSAHGNDIPEHERSLYQLADDCQTVAGDLLKLLSKIDPSDQSSKRDTLRAACKLVFKEDEMKSLQTRLEAFRSQLTLHLIASLR